MIATDYTVKLWERATGKLVGTWGPTTDLLFSVAVSPDGSLVAGGHRGKVLVWKVATGEKLWEAPVGWAMGLVFSADGSKLAEADSGDGMVRVWAAEIGDELLAQEAGSGKLTGVAFSPDGRRVAAAGQTRATVWDIAEGKLLLGLGAGKDWEDG